MSLTKRIHHSDSKEGPERPLSCEEMECQIIALKIKVAEERTEFDIIGLEKTMLLKKQKAISDLVDRKFKLKHSFLKRLLHCELLDFHVHRMMKNNCSNEKKMKPEIKELIRENDMKKLEFEKECTDYYHLYDRIHKIRQNIKKWRKIRTHLQRGCQSLQSQIDIRRQKESSLQKLRGVVTLRFGPWNFESKSETFLGPHLTKTNASNNKSDVPFNSIFKSRSTSFVAADSKKINDSPRQYVRATVEPTATPKLRKWPAKKNLAGMAA